VRAASSTLDWPPVRQATQAQTPHRRRTRKGPVPAASRMGCRGRGFRSGAISLIQAPPVCFLDASAYARVSVCCRARAFGRKADRGCRLLLLQAPCLRPVRLRLQRQQLACWSWLESLCPLRPSSRQFLESLLLLRRRLSSWRFCPASSGPDCGLSRPERCGRAVCSAGFRSQLPEAVSAMLAEAAERESSTAASALPFLGEKKKKKKPAPPSRALPPPGLIPPPAACSSWLVIGLAIVLRCLAPAQSSHLLQQGPGAASCELLAVVLMALGPGAFNSRPLASSPAQFRLDPASRHCLPPGAFTSACKRFDALAASLP